MLLCYSLSGQTLVGRAYGKIIEGNVNEHEKISLNTYQKNCVQKYFTVLPCVC